MSEGSGPLNSREVQVGVCQPALRRLRGCVDPSLKSRLYAHGYAGMAARRPDRSRLPGSLRLPKAYSADSDTLKEHLTRKFRHATIVRVFCTGFYIQCPMMQAHGLQMFHMQNI